MTGGQEEKIDADEPVELLSVRKGNFHSVFPIFSMNYETSCGKEGEGIRKSKQTKKYEIENMQCARVNLLEKMS